MNEAFSARLSALRKERGLSQKEAAEALGISGALLSHYENESTAICAYNAGMGNVTSWLETPEDSSDGVTLDVIPIGETREYLKRVTGNRDMYRELYAKELGAI